MATTTLPGLISTVPNPITAAWLMEQRACESGVEVFKSEWPTGAPITARSIQKASKLAIDLIWVADMLLKAPAEKAFHEAMATARKAYDEAMDHARKAFNEAVAPARKAFNEAVAPARKAFNEAVAPAEKAFNEAVDHARKAFNEAVATALWAAISGAKP